jgi:RHS repeat-associated protein
MFYGGLQNDPLARQFRNHYSSDGSMEIKENRLTNTFEFLTYIGGNAYSAPIVFKTDGGSTQKYLYLLRDYQQSIIAIADASGTLLEKRLFDAWGDILKAQDGNGNALVGLNVLDRGYTGHEHLVSVRLIHMNGRLYDPKLHRFLQPDNYVQDAFNTQNYNRYGYCWNNPFRYTDPSGEWIHVAAGAVIGGLVNWGMHGFQLNSKGLMAFGIGAAGGAMMACGNVAGLTFFQAGIVTAGFAVVGTMFTGVANHAAFGDPLPTMRQMAITAVISFATGGIFRAPSTGK